MRRTSLLIAGIVSLALLVSGIVLVAWFPQPYIITYYCSSEICPTQISGGISIWWVLVTGGLIAAVVALLMAIVRRRQTL